jgi:tRNA pseudouridine38-40 synthase
MRAFRVAYDGRPFHGFQRQPDVPTVEGTLLSALSHLGVVPDGADVPPNYAAAGRTDAGVSAVAQTVAFECPDWCTPAAVNSQLPGDVRAWAAAETPPDFHATLDATRREYTYFLYAPDLDDERARAALDALRGEHDFHNLTPDDERTVRTLDGDLRREGEFLVLRVAAGGFVRELVRRIVSLIRGVAAGETSLASVDRVLGSESLEGPEGVPAAPASPLVLTGVDYPDLSFVVDADAAESARAVFEERRVDGLTRARVAEAVLDRME